MSRLLQIGLALGCILAVQGPLSAATTAPLPAGVPTPVASLDGYFVYHPNGLTTAREPVTLRFEFRDGGEVVAEEVVFVGSPSKDEVLVSIPRPGLDRWRTADLAAPFLAVFANDYQVESFTPESLASYNLQLRYSRPELLAETADALHVERPGDIDGIQCYSPCGGGCNPSQDFDCDGVINSVDNCVDHWNPNQANCDGDQVGDACDMQAGIYQNSGPTKTCFTQVTSNISYYTIAHVVEQKQVDVSSCNGPDRWDVYGVTSQTCSRSSVQYNPGLCCLQLGWSIQHFGDSPTQWCGAKLNQNFCH